MKSVIHLTIIIVLIFSIIGTASADRSLDPKTLFSGYVTVEFNKETAKVGDTVLITVTANNNGLTDWYPVIIYAPIPSGLKYESHIVPDRTRQDYDPNTGIWDVNRMRSDERGLLKTLIITTKVKPEAAGKRITATARFQTLVLESYGFHMEDTEYLTDARSHNLIITETNNGNENKNGTGTGNGTGNGDGNGLINLLRGKLNDSQLNMADNANMLLNHQKGGGENGKSYEILNTTNQNIKTPQNTLYALLATLIIVILILIGYFKEIRKQ